MAATAKGCQTKTAEQHNQERRLAKARQNAVRKAKAATEEKLAKNYAAGFKFVSNESRLQLEADKKAEEEKKFRDAVNAIFQPWMKKLRETGFVHIPSVTQCNADYIYAMDRLLGVLESFPDLYDYIYRNEDLFVQRKEKVTDAIS